MKVKFSRCTSSNLANVPQVDGQLIYTKDTGEVYLDVGNERIKVNDLTEYVKNTDYASTDKGGVIKLGNSLSVNKNGMIACVNADYNTYKGLSVWNFIGKGTLENVIEGKELINQTQLNESQQSQDELIAELKKENENLRNALPSVTGKGTDIILDGTSKNKFKKFEVGGRTEQVQYDGRNLLPEATEETKSSNGITVISDGKGKYKINGTASANTQIYFDLTDSFTTSNETLYAHLRNNVIAPLSITIGNSQTASSPTCNSVNRIMTSNLLSNLLINRIGFIVASGETVDLEVEPSVELTNIVTDFEPFVYGIPSPNSKFPQPIKNVVGNIVNKVSNKNFFNKETVTANSYVNANNGKVAFSNNTASSDYINIENVSNVIISGDTEMRTNGGAFYNSNKEYISGFTTQQIHDGINVPSGSSYVRITTTTELLDVIQLESGTTATSYVPHQEQTTEFTLSEGQFLATRERLGDEGIVKNEVQILLDGTEKWIKRTNTNNTFQFNPGFTTKTGLCTHYTKFINGAEIDTKEGIYLLNTGAIIITDLRFTTVEEFKQWLAEEFINNPVMLQLVTATSSKIIPYTATQQEQYNAGKKLMSQKDKTIISSTSEGLEAILDVEAVADMSVQNASSVIEFNNEDTELEATNVEEAIKEVNTKVDAISGVVVEADEIANDILGE